MLKRLIVNADGFGFGHGATQGIFDVIGEGRFVTSVSVNANFDEVERIRELLAKFPNTSVGVHLNPMVGRPCLPVESVRSLVTGDGFFHQKEFLNLLRRGAVSLSELEAELDAQISRVRDLAGRQLTHLDSQANSHVHYMDLFLKLARKWQLNRIRNTASLICLEARNPSISRAKVYARKPQVWLVHQFRKLQMRKARAAGMRMADDLVTVGYAGTGNKSNIENWRQILRNLPDGTHEIYCHPAYCDDTLRRWSYYQEERAQELEILRGPELASLAQESGVEIVSFASI